MKFRGANWLLLLLVAGVYITGMFVDLMETDAAQYASMSLEMLRTGNYLEIFHRGADYIDKPPLIFWTTALSFKLFGVSNFTYKLPSVLFTLLGLLSTYHFTRMHYGKLAGYLATLVLASCHAWFQINQDVRTDTILAACTIFSIWQLAVFERGTKLINLIFASIGIAGAMLTKGPIGLMVPALALSTDLILKRKWSSFFRWQWLLAGVIVAACLAPMLYGLWLQFDATGGKETYNGYIDSGIRFYFWTQSFGRITGESTWQNNTGPFFFVHTFLWAFLPWSLLGVAAIGKKIWDIIKKGFRISLMQEGFTVGGILLPFLAFSLSRYKLPHYIFVLFPLVATLAAALIADVAAGRNRFFKAFRVTQSVVAVLLLVLTGLIVLYFFPIERIWPAVTALVGAVAVLYSIFYSRTHVRQLLLPSLLSIITLNFVLNSHFYPELLKFESGNAAGKIARTLGIPLVGYKHLPYAIDYYYRDAVPLLTNPSEVKAFPQPTEILIYTDEKGLRELQLDNIQVLSDSVLNHYHVSTLSAKFLLPARRSSALTPMHLIRVRTGQLPVD
jgi:4-amino-4-deoxy-L-arabinose transferase-like glycosyltransferase